MRLARKLMLLAAMATAATALAAPSAFAQHGPETEPLALPASTDLSLASETSGAVCGAVLPVTPPATGAFTTSGGCLFHGGGNNIVFSGHLFGIELVDFTCNWEFDLRLGGTGTGYLTHQELTQGTTGTCIRRPCNYPLTTGEEPLSPQGEARPWRAYIRENPAGTGPGTEAINLLFCLESRHTLTPRTNVRHCNVVIPFVESPNHRYTFTANDREGSTSSNGTRCELTGTFTTEATQLAGGESTRTQVEVNHL
ncbi:MAG TPA: hypothetical protein VEX36_07910 [Thermoleophilaceae bacterium]|nr:hypothetical protein [Thermoleophilaceae bacterium]